MAGGATLELRERTPSVRRRVPLRQMSAEPHECATAVRRRIVDQVPLFAGLDRPALAEIDSRMRATSWAEGQDLYTEGDPADHVYILASGRAKTLRVTPDGEEHVVDLLAPGDLFGGTGLLGSRERTETVRAMTTVCALRVGTEDLRRILLRHPEVGLRALEATGRRLELARAGLAAQALATVPQRVAAVLLQVARKFGRRTADGGILLEVPLSRADIASMTGSTPESVSRAMSRWRAEGLIESGRRWTELRDPERLEEIALG